MTGQIAIRPVNALAETILAKCKDLQLQGRLNMQSLGNNRSCLSVFVRNPAEAFQLGALVGSESGEVGFDRWPNGQQYVLFKDALVRL